MLVYISGLFVTQISQSSLTCHMSSVNVLTSYHLLIALMKSSESILLTSVYLPAKESKSHLTEYKEAIDQLYELHQKYNETQKINIGGDINEDLNEPTSIKRNLYLRDFINECCLKYDNKANILLTHQDRNHRKFIISCTICQMGSSKENKYYTICQRIRLITIQF